MNKLVALMVVITYMGFCGLLVCAGHWIVGTLLALLIMCGVKVKG